MWQPVSTAPFDRDLLIAVVDKYGAHTLVFPCRRVLHGWINAEIKKQIDVRPSHWQEWKPMYRNILIATDGSDLAEKAVSHGVSLAKISGAKVTALIVEAPFNVFSVPESQVREMSAAFAQHAEQIKKHAAQVLNHVADAAKRLVFLAIRSSLSTISPI